MRGPGRRRGHRRGARHGLHEPLLGDVEAGRLDACIGGPYAWEPLLGPTAPERRVVLRIDEQGGPSYPGYLLVARGDHVAERPAEVGAVAATLAGYRDALADLDRAVAVMHAVIPYFPPELVDTSTRLVSTAWPAPDGTLGGIRTGQLSSYAEWLHRYSLLDRADAWRGATTERFASGVPA